MMALVLDTRLIAGGDPVDIVNAAFSNTEVPQLVQVDASGPDVWHRLHSWDLGRGTHVQRFEGTGLRVSRRTKHLRLAAPERIALSIQYENPAWFATSRDTGHTIDPGQLHLVDQTSCHDFQWRGFAGAKAFVVDYDRLELSVDLCRKAATRLEASPVYDLVRSHIRNLCEDGPELVPGPARDMVGEATVELLRALITTAVDDAGQGAALDDTLQVRIRQYIDEHLTEPTLNAEQIARAHNISIRQFADNSGGLVHLRMQHWQLGAGAHVVEATGTASRLIRGREHLRIPAPERAAVAMQLGSAGYLDAGGIYTVTPPGHLHVADETQTFDLQWRGNGGSKAFVVDYDRLGVSVDVVREAAPRINASPVYSLFRSHLASLFASAETLPPGPAVTAVGNATTELFRALIRTVRADDERARKALHETLYLRITKYIELHLQEPSLNAERIASAHHISVRQLYNVWSVNDLPLGQWIIAARLEGARRELARPNRRAITIAALAHRWGFADATHFSHRFRVAYGLSPREWARLHAIR